MMHKSKEKVNRENDSKMTAEARAFAPEQFQGILEGLENK